MAGGALGALGPVLSGGFGSAMSGGLGSTGNPSGQGSWGNASQFDQGGGAGGGGGGGGQSPFDWLTQKGDQGNQPQGFGQAGGGNPPGGGGSSGGFNPSINPSQDDSDNDQAEADLGVFGRGGSGFPFGPHHGYDRFRGGGRFGGFHGGGGFGRPGFGGRRR